MFKDAAEYFIKIIFPPRCIFCGKPLDIKTKLEICSLCYNSIPFVSEQYCEQKLMTFTKNSIDQIICLCRYSGIIKSSLIRYKFFNKPGYHRTFARLLAERIQNMTDLNNIDIIASVPLYKKKKNERGYNQSLLISRQLAKELGIAEKSRLLERVKNTRSQSLLKNRSERYLNVKDAFIVNNSEQIINKTVLLVDDISTTGFTLEECAGALKKAGAIKVIGAVIAG